MITIDVRAGRALDQPVDALLLPVSGGADEWSGIALEIDAALGGEMKRLAGESEFTGAAGTTFMLPTLGAIASRRVCLVGTGASEPGGDHDDKRRRGWANGLRSAAQAGARSIAVALDSPGSATVELAAEGMLLGSYRFVEHLGSLRQRERDRATPEVTIVVDANEVAGVTETVRQHTAIAEGVYLARDLVSEPASALNPATMATRASDVAAAHGLECSASRSWSASVLERSSVSARAAMCRPA